MKCRDITFNQKVPALVQIVDCTREGYIDNCIVYPVIEEGYWTSIECCKEQACAVLCAVHPEAHMMSSGKYESRISICRRTGVQECMETMFRAKVRLLELQIP